MQLAWEITYQQKIMHGIKRKDSLRNSERNTKRQQNDQRRTTKAANPGIARHRGCRRAAKAQADRGQLLGCYPKAAKDRQPAQDSQGRLNKGVGICLKRIIKYAIIERKTIRTGTILFG